MSKAILLMLETKVNKMKGNFCLRSNIVSWPNNFVAISPVISARENLPLKGTQGVGNYKLFYFSFTHQHFSDQDTSDLAFYCNRSVGFFHLFCQRNLPLVKPRILYCVKPDGMQIVLGI